VTGKKPFNGDTPMQIVARHVNDPVPRPSDLVPVHPELERIILRTLQKVPAERYASAVDLASALRAVLPDLHDVPRGDAFAMTHAMSATGSRLSEATPPTFADPATEGDSGEDSLTLQKPLPSEIAALVNAPTELAEHGEADADRRPRMNTVRIETTPPPRVAAAPPAAPPSRSAPARPNDTTAVTPSLQSRLEGLERLVRVLVFLLALAIAGLAAMAILLFRILAP